MQANWQIYTGSDFEWDKEVDLNNSHYRQSSSWSKLKANKGWKIFRAQFDSNSKKTKIQVLYKKVLFMTFFFIPGGAIGSTENLDEDFIKFLIKKTNSKLYYIRIDDGSFSEKNLDFFSNSKIWLRPTYRLNEAKCAYFDLTEINSKDDYFKNSSKDFKSSIKNCRKKKLIYKCTSSPNSNELAEISISMFNKKKIKMMEFNDFENFKSAIGNQMHYVIAYDQDGTPLGYRAIMIIKDKAWDIAAATSILGRKKYAGFGCLEVIMELLISKSVREFNLGALNSNAGGVNAFKLGSGAKERFYVGEFEYNKFFLFRIIINLIISISLSQKFIQYNILRRLFF